MKNETLVLIGKETIAPCGNINESLQRDVEHTQAGPEEDGLDDTVYSILKLNGQTNKWRQ